jgi:sterol-4alpha-carboxylate 3-dehydrogenase (decarboxylating)
MPTYFVVVGGEGFLGNHIVTTLSSKFPSSKIFSLDLESRNDTLRNTSFQSIDLSAPSSLSNFFNSLSLESSDELGIFHTASPFLGASKELCNKINVEGTRNLIEALKDVKAKKKLVYTSSGSVVWSNRFLKNVDERLPFPDGKFPQVGAVGGPNELWGDIYNETKVSDLGV